MEKEVQATPQYSISVEELIAERNMVVRDILGQLGHEFGCELNKLKKKYIADTHDYIDCYELPTIMKERYKL